MNQFYEVRKSEFSVKNNLYEVAYSPHIHMDIEILHMRKGSQHLMIDGKSYLLKQGETAVIFPNIVHEYYKENISVSGVDEMLIICSKKFYGRFFPDMTDSFPLNPIIAKEELSPDAKYAFESISSSLSKNLQIAWTVIILSRILESVNLSQEIHAPIEDISFKIMKYIEEHFTEPISLESIANELCVAETYVSRVFSKKIKMNFRKYLGIVRAEYAANLLRMTDDKIITVAENSGFQSVSTFNRVFHDIYGMSPRDFRDNITKYTRAN